MLRIREKNCQIEIENEEKLFYSFDIYWRNSKNDLLHPDERCIDVMVGELMGKYNNKQNLGALNSNSTTSLESFYGFLKDNGIQWCPSYRIFYRDDENDDIPIDSDLEYKEALKFLVSQNENTRRNVMMIIEGVIPKINDKVNDEKTSAPLETSRPNATAECVMDDSKKCSKSKEETMTFHEMDSNEMKKTTSDSSANEQAFDMLRSYLENFKKEIVDDVVEIMEKKLLFAFGNMRSGNVDLNQENPIHESLNQENSQYEGMDTRFRRMRDEMQRHNRPGIETRHFWPPMFPPPRTHFSHPSNPPIPPPLLPHYAFLPFMDSSDYATYASLLAQSTTLTQLASDMFEKCDNNPKKNDTHRTKSQKKTNAGNTEATEVPENINESSSDSSSFEILSANSSPTHIGDDNPHPTQLKYKTVEVYDCSSDDEQHETTQDPTCVISSNDTTGKQKSKGKIVPELDKRPGGAYSYVKSSLLSTSSNRMTATDFSVDDNNLKKTSSENKKPTEFPTGDKIQSSTNCQDSNHNRSSQMNFHMNDYRYANRMDGRPFLNHGPSEDKRNESMKAYHKLLHYAQDYGRQNFRPVPISNLYSNNEGDGHYYGMNEVDDDLGRSNGLHSGWINPLRMNSEVARAFDTAKEALSVAHEVMDRTNKSQGSRM